MDCKEFERLLWDGPGELTPPMEQHLITCSKCRESYARYRQLFVLAEQSEVDRSEAFWQNFNSTVWEKIDKTETKPVHQPDGLWQRPASNLRRLSISAGLAIVTVVVLVVLVTDLTKKAPPPVPVASENYRTFDVKLEPAPSKTEELASGENPPQEKAAPGSVAKKVESEKEIAAVDRSQKPVLKSKSDSASVSKPIIGYAENAQQIAPLRGGRAPEMAAPSVSADTHGAIENADLVKGLVGSKDMNLAAVPQITADTNRIMTFQQFSILAEPKTEQKGDSGSVSIAAVFLTDDGLKNKQITVAQSVSTEEVVTSRPAPISLSRGNVQQTSYDESRVISLKKMPHPKYLATPSYPSLAYSLGKEGEVWVKAYLNASGKVEQAEIYRGSNTDYGFEEEALKAAYKNEFEPLEIDGQKLPAWILYKVTFVKAK